MFRLHAVILVTGDPRLAERAGLELADFPLVVCTTENFTPPTSNHFLLFIDADALKDGADREKFLRIGVSAQRILVGGSRCDDNRLARTFVPRDYDLREVVLRLARTFAAPTELAETKRITF